MMTLGCFGCCGSAAGAAAARAETRPISRERFGCFIALTRIGLSGFFHGMGTARRTRAQLIRNRAEIRGKPDNFERLVPDRIRAMAAGEIAASPRSTKGTFDAPHAELACRRPVHGSPGHRTRPGTSRSEHAA